MYYTGIDLHKKTRPLHNFEVRFSSVIDTHFSDFYWISKFWSAANAIGKLFFLPGYPRRGVSGDSFPYVAVSISRFLRLRMTRLILNAMSPQR